MNSYIYIPSCFKQNNVFKWVEHLRQLCNFQIILNLKCSKNRASLFYDCLSYLLPYRLGDIVKVREVEEDRESDLVNE